MPPASPITSCHALLTNNLTYSSSPSHTSLNQPIRPPHSRSQSISSTRSSSSTTSRRSSNSSASSHTSTSSTSTSPSGSLAGASQTYRTKLRPAFNQAPLHLPTTFVTVSGTPAPILGNIYVKLYGQSMSGEAVSVNLCDGGVREELRRLAGEGMGMVRVVGGVKFMFVGVDR